MVRDFFSKVVRTVSDFIHQPVKVLTVCLVLVFVGLVLDGTLFRLWALHRDSRELIHKMQVISHQTSDLRHQIGRAEDPKYIELQARQRFDLASEGDLIFVFSDGDNDASAGTE